MQVELALRQLKKAHRFLSFDAETVFLFLACLTWPFYFFQSGYPQLFVVFLICFCLVVIFKQSSLFTIVLKTKYYSYLLLLFLTYAYLVNGFYAIEFNSGKPIIYSIYLTLCFGVAIVFGACLLIKPDIRKTLSYGIAISLIVQGFLAVVVAEDFCVRHTLIFNNPNQLAFYSVLSLCFLVYQAPEIRLNRYLFFGAVVSAFILILISHSRAAMLSAGILLLVHFMAGELMIKTRLIAGICGCLLIVSTMQSFLSSDMSCFLEGATFNK